MTRSISKIQFITRNFALECAVLLCYQPFQSPFGWMNITIPLHYIQPPYMLSCTISNTTCCPKTNVNHHTVKWNFTWYLEFLIIMYFSLIIFLLSIIYYSIYCWIFATAYDTGFLRSFVIRFISFTHFGLSLYSIIFLKFATIIFEHETRFAKIYAR